MKDAKDRHAFDAAIENDLLDVAKELMDCACPTTTEGKTTLNVRSLFDLISNLNVEKTKTLCKKVLADVKNIDFCTDKKYPEKTLIGLALSTMLEKKDEIENSRSEIIDYLIKNGASLYNSDLHFALNNDFYKCALLIIDALVKKNHDEVNDENNIFSIDGKDKTELESTALMKACDKGSLDIVKALIIGGADVNIMDTKGRTALVIACSNNHIDIVEFLISINELEIVNIDNALFHAMKVDNIEIVKLLIKKVDDLKTSFDFQEEGGVEVPKFDFDSAVNVKRDPSDTNDQIAVSR